MPPQNLLADFAGGGLICAMGIAMALFERERSRKGQIIDASMVEGAAYVGSWIFKSRDMPVWSGVRGTSWYTNNRLIFFSVQFSIQMFELIRFDGGKHYYETYATKDGQYMTVGALEPQFYQELVDKLSNAGIDNIPDQYPDNEQDAKKRMADIFQQKTRDEWRAIFDGTDACVAPVLSLDEAALHPHNVSRKSFVINSKGQYDPAPAPRLSRTPAEPRADLHEPAIGDNSSQVLSEIGYTPEEVAKLIKGNVVHQTAVTSKL